MNFPVISQNEHQCTLYFRSKRDTIHIHILREFPCDKPEPTSMHSLPSGSRETPSTSTSSMSFHVISQNQHPCTIYLQAQVTPSTMSVYSASFRITTKFALHNSQTFHKVSRPFFPPYYRLLTFRSPHVTHKYIS